MRNWPSGLVDKSVGGSFTSALMCTSRAAALDRFPMVAGIEVHCEPRYRCDLASGNPPWQEHSESGGAGGRVGRPALRLVTAIVITRMITGPGPGDAGYRD
jgi:hypothetical protein